MYELILEFGSRELREGGAACSTRVESLTSLRELARRVAMGQSSRCLEVCEMLDLDITVLYSDAEACVVHFLRDAQFPEPRKTCPRFTSAAMDQRRCPYQHLQPGTFGLRRGNALTRSCWSRSGKSEQSSHLAAMQPVPDGLDAAIRQCSSLCRPASQRERQAPGGIAGRGNATLL